MTDHNSRTICVFFLSSIVIFHQYTQKHLGLEIFFACFHQAGANYHFFHRNIISNSPISNSATLPQDSLTVLIGTFLYNIIGDEKGIPFLNKIFIKLFLLAVFFLFQQPNNHGEVHISWNSSFPVMDGKFCYP